MLSQGHQIQLLDNGYRIIYFLFVKPQRFIVMVMSCCAVLWGVGDGGGFNSVELARGWTSLRQREAAFSHTDLSCCYDAGGLQIYKIRQLF